jgi:hypothetical protein
MDVVITLAAYSDTISDVYTFESCDVTDTAYDKATEANANNPLPTTRVNKYH